MPKFLNLPIISILILAFFMTSCASISEILANSDKPTVKIIGTKLQDLTLEKVNLMFDVEIHNPYSLPLPLSNLQYSLTSKGEKFLDGKADVQGLIPAQNSKVVQIPVGIPFVPVLQALKQVKPGAVVPYDAKLDLSVDAPGVGPINLPLEKEGELPIPAIPKVELTNIQWQEMSMSKATANLNLKIDNPNSFPIELNKFNYRLNLADTPVAEDQITQGTKFAENGSNTFQVPLSIAPIKLGFAAFQMLQGKGANYNLDGGLEVASPFGPINFPISSNGQTTFQR